MERCIKTIRFLVCACFLLLGAKVAKAQCTAGFVYSVHFGGLITFTSTSTGTINAATSYSWNFGNASSPVTGPNVTTTTGFYPSPGSYTVTLAISNPTTPCFSFTQAVIIVPNCSVSMSTLAAASPSTCNGSATVTGLTGLCAGPVTYSWSNATTGPVLSNVCPGLYTVLITSGVPSGTNCCPTMTAMAVIGTQSCNILGSYTYSQNPNGNIQFINNSSGNLGNAVYNWYYGDGSSGTGFNPNYTYQTNGTYPTTLIITNTLNPLCGDTVMVPVVVTNTAACNLVSNFISANLGNGNVLFTSTSTGTNASTSYTWTYGDASSPAIGTGLNQVNHIYTPGTYFASLKLMRNAPTCTAVSVHSVVITPTITPPPCTLNAMFSSNTGTNGVTNFSSTSTGTVGGTTYSWKFGDGSSLGSGANTAHTYTLPGTYSVRLIANNNFSATCIDSVSQNVVVPVFCPIIANFTYSQTANNTISFTSTSTGTNSGTNFSWNFGDSNFGVGIAPSHIYAGPGTYNVLLTVSNNSFCVSTKTMAVNIPSLSCNLAANFTHTLTSNGVVNFGNSTAGTNANTGYYWNFGDGVFSTLSNPSHTYINAGTHFVKLIAADSNNLACTDTITSAINITGISCVANSNFTLTPTATPQFWIATPSYPWNVTAATWSWGDGIQTHSLYASHTYSAAGMYSICLSVTVSCGGNSTSCTSYSVYRSSGTSDDNSIINVNVLPPAISTNIESETIPGAIYTLYPNPNSGEFNLNIDGLTERKAMIIVYDLVGKTVYFEEHHSDSDTLNATIQLEGIDSGIYFIRISSGSKTLSGKILIDK